MAITFTGAGIATALSGASPQAVTTATSLGVGDYLVVLIVYDNSGTSGADPMTGTITLSPAAGAVGASVSAQTGLNDPGAINAGLAARCVAFPVTTTIPTSTSINVNWSGTIVFRVVIFMKVSSAATTGYRTNHGATGTNTTLASAAAAFVTPSVNDYRGRALLGRIRVWRSRHRGRRLHQRHMEFDLRNVHRHGRRWSGGVLPIEGRYVYGYSNIQPDR